MGQQADEQQQDNEDIRGVASATATLRFNEQKHHQVDNRRAAKER